MAKRKRPDKYITTKVNDRRWCVPVSVRFARHPTRSLLFWRCFTFVCRSAYVKAGNFRLRPGALSLLNKDRSCPGILLYFFLYNILLRKAVPLFFQSFLRTSVRSTYIVWQMPANRRATSIPFYGNFNSRTIPAYRTFPSIYVTPQVSGHSLPWSISPVFFLPWVSPSSDTHPEQNLWLFQNMYLCSS